MSEEIKKIAVIGWYDRLNAGDERIRYAVSKMLNPHKVAFVNLWQWPPPLELLGSQDWVLIGGGGLWVGPSLGFIDDVDRWSKRIRARLGVLGVSAEKNFGMVKPTEQLLRKADFFHVRDSESRRSLEEKTGIKGKIAVYTDLTFAVPFQKNLKCGPHEAVSVASLGVVLCLPGNLGEESPDWSYLKDLARRHDACGLPFNEDGDHDNRVFQSLEIPYFREFDIQVMRAAEIVVCARFHAMIFCIQMGVPFIAVTCSGKIRQFCADNDLTDLTVETGDAPTVDEKIKFIRKHRQAVLEKIEKANVKNAAVAAGQLQEIRQVIGRSPAVKYGLTDRIRHRLAREIY